jgi:SAM-dependent methyltransferase
MRVSVPDLLPTRCAICDTDANADELYPANFDPKAFNPDVFSARRLPDSIHYRIVQCRQCGLVRSDPVISSDRLAQLYAGSHFDYGNEVPMLQRTYAKYLRRLRRYRSELDSLLEIGAGNGFFLEVALAEGFTTVNGIEPSAEAIAAARPDVRPTLVRDILRPGLFPPESFDAVCAFQVLDHVPEPLAFLRECHAMLKPRGLVLLFMHNVAAISARIMKSRSPIIDIEHTYLYSPSTITRLLQRAGFRVEQTGAATNVLTTAHLLHLLPAPGPLKKAAHAFARATRLAGIPLLLPLGNLYAIARRL